MKHYVAEIKFERDILGSNAADEQIKRTYIESKMTTGRTGISGEIAKQKLDEEQVNAMKDKDLQKMLSDIENVSLTVFYRDKKGIPCISDHQIRGWFKEAFAFLNGQNNYLTKRDKTTDVVTTYKDDYSKKWINERIHFEDRFYSFSPKINYKKDVTIMTRPIRMMTMQGPRTSIKSSELITAGHKLTIKFSVTDDVSSSIIKDVFNRGIFRGLGAWSNAQWGTFQVLKIKKLNK